MNKTPNYSSLDSYQYSFEDLKDLFIDDQDSKIDGFLKFEGRISQLKNTPKLNHTVFLLFDVFKFLDNLHFENNFIKDEDLILEKKIIKYFFLLRFLNLSSYEDNRNWLDKFVVKSLNDHYFSKKIFSLVANVLGVPHVKLGEFFNVSRAMTQQYIKKFCSDHDFEFKDFKDFSEKIKNELLKLQEKKFIDKYIKQYGRLPIESDDCQKDYSENQFFQNILTLNLSERVDLYKEFGLDITQKEYDYHFEYLREDLYAGNNYWKNFETLKEFIYRHAKDLGEPDLMPKQTSFRRGVGAAIGKHGGQSFVAKKIGLKYQGQLVNESGGRVFWTEERIKTLLKEVNILFEQDDELMPWIFPGSRFL